MEKSSHKSDTSLSTENQSLKSWWILVGALTVFYFLLYGAYLSFPPEMYYDEVYQTKTAQQVVAGSGWNDTAHPPLIKLLIAGCIFLFGNSSWVWRLVSLFSGYGCLWLIFLIVRRWTGNMRLAFFSVMLFLLDGIPFTMSRIGMIHMGMLFWMLAALFAIGQSMGLDVWNRRRGFLFAGICFGFAVNSRIVGASAAFFLLFPLLKIWKTSATAKFAFVRDLFFWFGVPALLAYLLPYLYLLFNGAYGTWQSIFEYQKNMLHYHFNLTEWHTYASRWWGWPFLVRPIWLYFIDVSGANEAPETWIRGILCIGNPVIYWVLVPAFVWNVWLAMKKQNHFSILILIGFLSQWLWWAFVGRFTFFLYFLTAVPFAAMMISVVLEDLWRRQGSARILAGVYLAAVLVSFIYWYPLYAGIPIPGAWFRQHMWFQSWI